MDTFFDSMLESQLQQPPPPPPQEAEQALDDLMNSFLDPVPRLKQLDPRQRPPHKPVSKTSFIYVINIKKKNSGYCFSLSSERFLKLR
jgi:hypothetical protein